MSSSPPDFNIKNDLILALETSTLAGSLALHRAGTTIAHCELPAQQRRTGALFPELQKMLASADCQPADIGICAFSAGPGSFTGLRLAATIARMLKLTVNCRVVAVPSLAVIAANALPQPIGTRICVGVDARRGQLYSIIYEVVPATEPAALPISPDFGLQTLSPLAIRTPAALADLAETPIIGIGTGIADNAAAFAGSGWEILSSDHSLPNATTVAQIAAQRAIRGEFCQPHEIVPCYVRPPECEEVFEKRRADAIARREKSPS